MESKKKFELIVQPNVDKVFSKLVHKNPKRLRIISKKIEQILENPFHFKSLRGSLKGSRRGHIDNSFVLIYEIKENKVILMEFNHHDKIY